MTDMVHTNTINFICAELGKAKWLIEKKKEENASRYEISKLEEKAFHYQEILRALDRGQGSANVNYCPFCGAKMDETERTNNNE